jgi:ATP-dependent Clp endopeptidase proteolytic subunit ClpP
MQHGARPLRSTRRLSNLTGQRPGWYHIANAAGPGLPAQVSIYDEIGFFGVSAGDFMAELKGVSGDIELHLNSPGGDVFDGIAIFNQLKQRKGDVHVIVDGLAASAASFIAQAASPGQLEVAPHSQMMIHNGFSMAIGDAADLRTTADLLDKITNEIASIYAERSGKPVAYWLGQMAAETWYSDAEAVADGLADNIHGQGTPANAWDLSVYAKAAPEGADAASDGDDAPDCPTCKGSGKIRDGHVKCPACGGTGKADPKDPDADPAPADAADVQVTNAADPSQAKPLGDQGWVQDPDGKVRFDPDGDGDDDSTAAGDTDHDYFDADGKQIKPIPPKPAASNLAGMWPVLAGSVDNSEWDGGKAMANGAASDDPAKFYAGICAGRKAGDASTQEAWALPYKYHPGDAVNAAGVKNALSRLPQAKGLTNADEAKATLEKAMRAVNPDYDPDALADPALLAGVFTVPDADVDDSAWNPQAALALAASSRDPAAFYAGICAGRRQGDPATAEAWALPYRYTPGSPPNAAGVREALADLPLAGSLANADEARSVLDKAMKAINPAHEPDDQIDPELLVAAFASALKGAGSK